MAKKISMSEIDQVDEFLFAVCCSRRMHSLQFAADCIRLKLEGSDLSLETIASVAALNYQNHALPSTRQHILRMAMLYCPEQLESLPEKLDGCSESKHLEVLSALQKRYGLVVGSDVAATIEPMETLMHRNRALAKENMVLRQQLVQQKENSALLSTHQELMERLYDCVATIEALSSENASLRREINCETERSTVQQLPKVESAKASHSDQWAHRCSALQKRLEELIEQQIEERTQHSSTVLSLKTETSSYRENLAQQTSRANALAQQIAEVRAKSIANEGGVVHLSRLLTKDNSAQTTWSGDGAIDDQSQCHNEPCRDLARQVEALTMRLAAAMRMLKR